MGAGQNADSNCMERTYFVADQRSPFAKNVTKPNTADSITSFTIPRNTSMTQK